MKRSARPKSPIRMVTLLSCAAAVGLVSQSDASRAEDPWPWSGRTGEDAVTLLLLGDFNVQQREDPADALANVHRTLNDAELVYANLEGLLVESKGAARDLPNKSGWTHLGAESVQALVAGNISVVGVANNVAYGRDDIMASLSVLDANGIAHTGAGEDIEAAHEPAIVERSGVRFGFLQYTSKWYDESKQVATEGAPGVARLKSPDGTTIEPGDLDRMLDDIRRLRPRVDVLVVSAHTRDGQRTERSTSDGSAAEPATASRAEPDLYSRIPVNESLQQVEPYQKRLARAAIDAGADIVFGHGCHMLQAVETYADKPVMYCLGNFASDWIRVRNYRDGLVARVVVEDKAVERVSLVPVTRDPESNNVRFVEPETPEGERLYGTLRALSEQTALTREGQELVLFEKP